MQESCEFNLSRAGLRLPGAVLLSVLLFLGTGLSACNDGAPANELPAPPLAYELEMDQVRGGGVAIKGSIEGTSEGDGSTIEFARNVRHMYVVLRSPEGRVLDTVKMSPIADAGMWNLKSGNDTLRLYDEVVWSNPEGLVMETISAELLLEHVDGSQYATRKTYELKDLDVEVFKGLSLRPLIEEQTDSSAIFTLLTQRRRSINNEHFTTEETFRVEILDGDLVVWSSAHGVEYRPMFAAVEPLEDGSFQRNTVKWNGKTTMGADLPAGEYTVRLTIPSQPTAYIDSLTLNWKQPQ